MLRARVLRNYDRCTHAVIFEIDDKMAEAMKTDRLFRTTVAPLPARIHPPREVTKGAPA